MQEVLVDGRELARQLLVEQFQNVCQGTGWFTALTAQPNLVQRSDATGFRGRVARAAPAAWTTDAE
jgi:hypothetical protein